MQYANYVLHKTSETMRISWKNIAYLCLLSSINILLISETCKGQSIFNKILYILLQIYFLTLFCMVCLQSGKTGLTPVSTMTRLRCCTLEHHHFEGNKFQPQLENWDVKFIYPPTIFWRKVFKVLEIGLKGQFGRNLGWNMSMLSST